MTRAPMKHLRTVMIGLLILLIPGGAFAQPQTQEQVQERLVDLARKATQEANSATGKFNAGDTAGGCSDLRAAAADTAGSLDLVQPLSGLIGQDTALLEGTRNRMLQDVLSMSAALTSQKQDMDAQIAARCD